MLESLNKKVLDSLVRSGALDRFGERARLFAGLELLVKSAAANSKANVDQAGLFGDDDAGAKLPLIELPQASEDKQRALNWEKELLGLYLSDHPIKEFSQKLSECARPINEITIELANQAVRVGGVVHEVKKITTKSNQTMAFVQIEDLTGIIEAVVFPSVYESYKMMWNTDQMVVVEGKISDKDGSPKVLVDKVWSLPELNTAALGEVVQSERKNYPSRREGYTNHSSPPSPTRSSLFVVELPSNITKVQMEHLKQALQKFPGQSAVELRMIEQGSLKTMRPKLTVRSCDELRSEVAQALSSSPVAVS